MKKSVKPIKCYLNGSVIRISFRLGIGAEVLFDHAKGFEMAVGGNADWDIVYTCLLHEIVESTAILLELRFERCRCNEAQYYFIWTHSEFARVMEHVGLFLSEYIDTLKKVWEQWKKETSTGSSD